MKRIAIIFLLTCSAFAQGNKILAPILLGAPTVASGPTPTLVNSWTYETQLGGTQTTGAIAPANGDLLIACTVLSDATTTVTSVKDNNNVALTLDHADSLNTTKFWCWSYTVSGSPTSLTVTVSSSSPYWAIIMMDFSHPNATPYGSASTVTTDTNTTFTTSAVTPAYAGNNIIIGLFTVHFTGSYTAGTGYTTANNINWVGGHTDLYQAVYKVQSGTAAATPNITGPSNAAYMMSVSYKGV